MFKWGDHVPTRMQVLTAQGFHCKGSDGTGCHKKQEWPFWMTVILVGDSFWGVCRSCYAKITASARAKKGARTISMKRAQLELPLGSAHERSKPSGIR